MRTIPDTVNALNVRKVTTRQHPIYRPAFKSFPVTVSYFYDCQCVNIFGINR